MKSFIIVLFFLFVFNQKQTNYVFTSDNRLFEIKLQDTTKYKVYKIDSINNYYIIYAQKNCKSFKMVSEKFRDSECTQIVSGNIYNFKLYSVFSSNGNLLFKTGIAHLHAWQPDESTIITLEGDGVSRDLFFTDNLKGLCYIENEE